MAIITRKVSPSLSERSGTSSSSDLEVRRAVRESRSRPWLVNSCVFRRSLPSVGDAAATAKPQKSAADVRSAEVPSPVEPAVRPSSLVCRVASRIPFLSCLVPSSIPARPSPSAPVPSGPVSGARPTTEHKGSKSGKGRVVDAVKSTCSTGAAAASRTVARSRKALTLRKSLDGGRDPAPAAHSPAGVATKMSAGGKARGKIENKLQGLCQDLESLRLSAKRAVRVETHSDSVASRAPPRSILKRTAAAAQQPKKSVRWAPTLVKFSLPHAELSFYGEKHLQLCGCEDICRCFDSPTYVWTGSAVDWWPQQKQLQQWEVDHLPGRDQSRSQVLERTLLAERKVVGEKGRIRLSAHFVGNAVMVEQQDIFF